MTIEELWRPVVGLEGLYEVSNLGQVRSVDRVVTETRRGRLVQVKRRGYLLTPRARSGKYDYLVVRINQVARLVHQLVAEAWLGPPAPGQMVCHGPAGMYDNSVSNLRWDDNKGNQHDRRDNGPFCPRRVVRSDGREYASMAAAAEDTGCMSTTISDVCRGKGRTAGGYGWKYAPDAPDCPRIDDPANSGFGTAPGNNPPEST